MEFDASILAPAVRQLLALEGGGARLLPLVCRGPSNPEATTRLRAADPAAWFAGARSPQGAMAGLWLYFSLFEECHAAVQDLSTAEGSYWHGILHRQEPDDWNAGYWFRKAGPHPIHGPLLERAAHLARQAEDVFDPGGQWDPLRFVELCSQARQRPGSGAERLALEIQLAEWQLLFAWCASVRG
ncbi:MAG: hypothetical protein HZB13_15525 [Acidobacteria bacterium]|nr:hypothetical protein [Acidobacteriota bacterium]